MLVLNAGVKAEEWIAPGADLEVDIVVVVGESLIPETSQSARLARPCAARFGV